MGPGAGTTTMRLHLGSIRSSLFVPWIRRGSRGVHTTFAENFEEWLQAHPLPGTVQQGGSAGCPPRRIAQQLQQLGFQSTRFAWQDTPQICARCLVDGQLVWRIESGAFIGSTAGADGGGEAVAVLRLQLPRVLAGLFPEIKDLHEPRDSPLGRPADAEHTAVVGVLHSLARHAQQGGAGQEAGGKRAEDAALGLGATAGVPVLGDPAPQQIQQLGLKLGSQLIVLLSADSAALALLSEGEMVEHKVLKAYTVRHSQGKAQLTHERQGGGARSVGGSIRRREGRRLSQAAAAKLAEWAPLLVTCNQLYGGGTVWAWNELYSSKSPGVPVERHDPRWRRVGVGVRRPRLQDLQRVAGALLHGTLTELHE